MELENMTTSELIAAIDGGVYDNSEIVSELQYRVIPANDVATSYTEYRGGIRPTHIPTH